MREGFSTGACAAAATQAAARLALGLDSQMVEDVLLLDGTRERLPIAWARLVEGGAEAGVIKDAGDDPDITHQAEVRVCLHWREDQQIKFKAGDGVGMVTLPGLQIPVGEPAINPGPRRMMATALHSLSQRGVDLEVSIPGGVELAARTFNPRLGVQGGLSILGTTGRVRPFSLAAIQGTIVCALDIARAAGCAHLVLVPGNIGEKAARANLALSPEQVIVVSNEWGFALDAAKARDFKELLLVGHPGKLAKLWLGDWDTHSSRSASALPQVADLAQQLTGRVCSGVPTVEGVFQALSASDQLLLCRELETRIAQCVWERLQIPVTVVLCTMDGQFWSSVQ